MHPRLGRDPRVSVVFFLFLYTPWEQTIRRLDFGKIPPTRDIPVDNGCISQRCFFVPVFPCLTDDVL